VRREHARALARRPRIVKTTAPCLDPGELKRLEQIDAACREGLENVLGAGEQANILFGERPRGDSRKSFTLELITERPPYFAEHGVVVSRTSATPRHAPSAALAVRRSSECAD
jgi:hypothetical protein